MTKSKALQILIDINQAISKLPQIKGLPVGKGHTATRTSIKNKITFIKNHKTENNLHQLLVTRAKKDYEDYLFEVYKREEGDKYE